MDAANGNQEFKEDKEYRKFMRRRYIAGILAAVVLVGGGGFIISKLSPPGTATGISPAGYSSELLDEKPVVGAPEFHSAAQAAGDSQPSHTPKTSGSEKDTPAANSEDRTRPPDGKTIVTEAPPGAAFVEGIIEPIEYELHGRFWGWRPNDIVNITDNVNEFQIGVLEVTRRATVALTDRISRRGSAESLDPHLERAMNWFMIKADSYWFPAPETRYAEAIEELRHYKSGLHAGSATFYTRADNLIPLLRSFVELLGSCDQNLVKHTEPDGGTVSTFQADNYFYYAKGVAKAMHSILKAVEHDFERTLEIRGGSDIMHHAIESCHIASELDPWLWISEADLNGIFANHRSNMAGPISHARFYLDLLAEALST